MGVTQNWNKFRGHLVISIYCMVFLNVKVKKGDFCRKNVITLSLCTLRYYGRHNISSGILILVYGVISLSDATSNGKYHLTFQRLCYNIEIIKQR